MRRCTAGVAISLAICLGLLVRPGESAAQTTGRDPSDPFPLTQGAEVTHRVGLGQTNYYSFHLQAGQSATLTMRPL